MKPKCGVTLIELLIAITIVGILASFAIPAIGGTKKVADEQSAIGKAQALNQAKQVFKFRVASPNWPTDNASRYTSISAYIPMAAATLATYQPTGYSFDLGGNLDAKVIITGPAGAITY